MSHKPGMLATSAVLILAAGLAAQQLTPREMFYKPRTPGGAAQGKRSNPQPKGNKGDKKDGPTEVAGGSQQPGPRPDPRANVILANATPLGLKYSIIKRIGEQAAEVPADTVFHAKDGIQIRVETNGPGYLYIVNKGSSGTWKPMFPAPEIAGGNNRVEGFAALTLPSAKHQMTFDQQSGTENLFIVFSRVPVPDFEELIYSLKDKPPAGDPARNKELMAKAEIGDSVVGRLRGVYARDLIIEPVTPATTDSSPAKKETATYVVRPDAPSDSRLVADLPLRHE
jgi:hypothetical protein